MKMPVSDILYFNYIFSVWNLCSPYFNLSELYMLLLTDEQFVEGIYGGIASLIIRELFVKQYKKKNNLFIIVTLSWTVFWFTRKIGNNIYKQMKETYNIKNKNFELNFKNKKLDLNMKNFLIVIISIIILKYVLLIRIVKIPKLKKIGTIELNLIFFTLLIFYFVFIS